LLEIITVDLPALGNIDDLTLMALVLRAEACPWRSRPWR